MAMIDKQVLYCIVLYCYNKGDYVGLRAFMERDWIQEFSNSNNVNSVWLTFKSILSDGVRKFIPITAGNSWKRNKKMATSHLSEIKKSN